MTRLLTASILLFLFAGAGFAQTDYSDRCHVYVASVTGRKASQAKFSELKELGTFDTVSGEEELTMRSYRLPGSKLFVIASVWYTDESLAST